MIGPRDSNGKLKTNCAKVPAEILDAEENVRKAYSKYQIECGELHSVIAKVKKDTGYEHPWPFSK